MIDPNIEEESTEQGGESLPTDDVSDSEEAGHDRAVDDRAGDEPLTEKDYALGETSDPGGAARSEPAGEDYAGSGF